MTEHIRTGWSWLFRRAGFRVVILPPVLTSLPPLLRPNAIRNIGWSDITMPDGTVLAPGDEWPIPEEIQ